MNTVTLTGNYQLDFPKNISEAYGLEIGDTFEFISYNNRIELIPLKPIRKMKGLFQGIDTTILREDDRI